MNSIKSSVTTKNFAVVQVFTLTKQIRYNLILQYIITERRMSIKNLWVPTSEQGLQILYITSGIYLFINPVRENILHIGILAGTNYDIHDGSHVKYNLWHFIQYKEQKELLHGKYLAKAMYLLHLI